MNGKYTPTPLDSSVARAGAPRLHKDQPKEEEQSKPLTVNPAVQTPSQRTPGRVNSNIAQNVRAGFQAGGAEGEHQAGLREATAADLEAQRSRNTIS